MENNPLTDDGLSASLAFLSGQVLTVLDMPDAGLDATGRLLRSYGAHGVMEPDSEKLLLWRLPVLGLPYLLVRDRHEVDSAARDATAHHVRSQVDLPEDDPETSAVHDTLAAFQSGDSSALTQALLGWASQADAKGHYLAAAEIYRCAFVYTSSLRDIEAATDAARFIGRSYRRLALYDECILWYERALDLAAISRDPMRLLAVYEGLAPSHAQRGRGPEARACVDIMRNIAEAVACPDAFARYASAHMTNLHGEGKLDDAIQIGIAALERVEEPSIRTPLLAILGGSLTDAGHLEAASDAWVCITYYSSSAYYLAYAYEALANFAAITYDRAGFEAYTRLTDSCHFRTGAPHAAAEILEMRAKSLHILGERDRAIELAEEAMAVASDNKLNQLVFQIEATLQTIHDGAPHHSVKPRVFSEDTHTALSRLRDLRMAVSA